MKSTPRTVEVSDALWRALETMSQEMSVEVASLVNQAIFMLAREHGFVVPTRIELGGGPAFAEAPPEARSKTPAEVPVAASARARSKTPAEVPAAAPAVARTKTPAEVPAAAPAVARTKTPPEVPAEAADAPTKTPPEMPAVAADAPTKTPPEMPAVAADAPTKTPPEMPAVAADVPTKTPPEVPAVAAPEPRTATPAEVPAAPLKARSETPAKVPAVKAEVRGKPAAAPRREEPAAEPAPEAPSLDALRERAVSRVEAINAAVAKQVQPRPDAEEVAPEEAEPIADAPDTGVGEAQQGADGRTLVGAVPGPAVRLSRRGFEPVVVGPDRFVIGRTPGCDLVIESNKVSREHAAVVREGAEVFVEDLGSANGTWVAGASVKRKRLSDQDEIVLGGELLVVTIEEAKAAAKQAAPAPRRRSP